MEKPVLVIMAAGMGSRYGGLKQIDAVDEQGHIIIDFSIFDAIRAGFRKIIFIIKHEMEEEFKEVIGDRIEKIVEVEYVFQEVTKVPDNFTVPDERVKPWGTGHAILCCKDKVKGPFAVINADDFYGREAFTKIYDFLDTIKENQSTVYTMVGYQLENTLTENGSVARGVCDVNEEGFLTEITERTKIERFPDGAKYFDSEQDTWEDIPFDKTVSMNLWGFKEDIMKELEEEFNKFLEREVSINPTKSEFFLPTVVQHMIEKQKVQVKVLNSDDKWFGVTYKEDKEVVQNEIAKLKKQGVYPTNLW
ncbi:Nucleotidyl transferase [Anaerosporobacter mobilis DSM 15930]|jgi:dTDP-glucose pyrophosphorylase|uniref:Nucleotidyl transferase n=1 Tax=Anaerosporobacter mobilis DSM 15930 TaxID=1120996 RepID=A0A1M7JGB8_9FIRM|nr:sugar phosphate nucleotidyltransferase [Anaerosporobacter mobilis]SHM51961.1 Nucleotidyl transferase [Anaerosporobacter mobilis DSM 15930]